ncbi:winged helix-turn-helix transcriptional regulator [Streptomyces sp. NPDC091281]|uniref:winged helix-turn-helix transcriptional regulator n=1 Tax=Streptomyces sp. NPDC091281 TaxID=3365985 RepID=UPI003807F5FD
MRMHNADETCGVARAATVLGDWWNVLVLREIARGHVRFDALAAGIGLSRNVLTERLGRLVAAGVLRRSLYQRRPVRYEYLLTDAGAALVPVLVAMQEWGDRWVLGEGSVTPHVAEGSAEAERVRGLVGVPLPDGLQLQGEQGVYVSVVPEPGTVAVLFTFPGVSDCLGESPVPAADDAEALHRLFREAWPEFRDAGVAVTGVSTQLVREQREFARAERLPYPVLSDADHRLAAALRLPTFPAAGRLRHKGVLLVVDAERVVRHALLPGEDPAASVAEALRLAREASRTPVT